MADAAAAAGVETKVGSTTKRLAEGPPVIALAWDRLGPESRALAHRAAKRLVETKALGDLIVVSRVEPFTAEPEVAARHPLVSKACCSTPRLASLSPRRHRPS